MSRFQRRMNVLQELLYLYNVGTGMQSVFRLCIHRSSLCTHSYEHLLNSCTHKPDPIHSTPKLPINLFSVLFNRLYSNNNSHVYSTSLAHPICSLLLLSRAPCKHTGVLLHSYSSVYALKSIFPFIYFCLKSYLLYNSNLPSHVTCLPSWFLMSL